jgi:hypothetical protein
MGEARVFEYDTNNLSDITRDLEEALFEIIPDHCVLDDGEFSGKYVLTLTFVEGD